MGFSNEWEEFYKNHKHLSIWPWADLISLVKKYTKLNSTHKVLELGIGAGANIPFFLNQEVQFYGIDGSEAIISFLHERFPSLTSNLRTADFVKEIPFDETFDLIVDRGAMTCNNTRDLEASIALIYKHLKPGGLFIGIDWFSTQQSDYKKGRAEDAYTEYDFQEGLFYQMGKIHFSDEDHLKDLFKAFEFLHLDHKIVQQILPDPNFRMGKFNFVVKKAL